MEKLHSLLETGRELLSQHGMSFGPHLTQHTSPSCSATWNLSGLLVLADLTTLARRTALTGTASLLDVFVLCPGLHTQQRATRLNEQEFPAVGAMTTGYVFRVENPATVLWLQKVGRTGCLTTVRVEGGTAATTEGMKDEVKGKGITERRWWDRVVQRNGGSMIAGGAYHLAVTLTLVVGMALVRMQDWWALGFLMVLMLARSINVLIVRRRAVTGWKGAAEPGVQSDLIVLMTQDRWIRIQGATDDVKAVTSGNWLRDQGFWERAGEAIATLMVYLDVVVLGGATGIGVVWVLGLLVCSVGLIAVANEFTSVLNMQGRMLMVEGEPKAYARRRVLAEELVEEKGRDDWAIGLGMIVKEGATVQAVM